MGQVYNPWSMLLLSLNKDLLKVISQTMSPTRRYVHLLICRHGIRVLEDIIRSR